MILLEDALDAIADASLASTALDRVTTRIVLGELDSGDIVAAVNRARSKVDLALDRLDAEIGVAASALATAMLAHAASVSALANVALSQSQSPREITLERGASARAILFERFGSMDLLPDFLALNPGTLSVNFYPAGAVVRLPRG